jgi:hypothetical protein
MFSRPIENSTRTKAVALASAAAKKDSAIPASRRADSQGRCWAAARVSNRLTLSGQSASYVGEADLLGVGGQQ